LEIVASWQVEYARVFDCIDEDGVFEEVPHFELPIVTVDPKKRYLLKYNNCFLEELGNHFELICLFLHFSSRYEKLPMFSMHLVTFRPIVQSKSDLHGDGQPSSMLFDEFFVDVVAIFGEEGIEKVRG
jgi:hypothetical protein